MALRALGAFEDHFAAFAEIDLPIFCVAARVRGRIEYDKLAKAAAAVQSRHGILAAAIRRSPDGRRTFYASSNPLFIEVRKAVDATWQEAAALDVVRPFDMENGPLVRIIALEDGIGADILLTMHHAVADGMSAVMVLRDLLCAHAGMELMKHASIESMDQLLAKDLPSALHNMPLKDVGGAYDVKPWMERNDFVPKVRTITLDRSSTDRIVSAAREHNTTVHSVLSVAFARVLHGNGITTAQGSVRVVSPINVRPYLNNTQQCGLFFSGMMDVYKPSNSSFWDDARAAHASIVKFQNKDAALRTLVNAIRLSDRDDSPQAAKEAMRPIVNRELLLSNLGRINIPRNYGPLHLERVTGPIMSQCVHGDNLIGAATFQGELQLVHTTIDGYAPLLEETVDLLHFLSAGTTSPR
jgi:NRPS condensation-like uncharacterized protein